MGKIKFTFCSLFIFALTVPMFGCGSDEEENISEGDESEITEITETAETEEAEEEEAIAAEVSDPAQTVTAPVYVGPVPDILKSSLTSYTDNDFEITFTLEYPEEWYMARDVAGDNLDNGVELLWSTYPLEDTRDLNDPENFEGAYWIGFHSSLYSVSDGAEEWFETGSFPQEHIDSFIQERIDLAAQKYGTVLSTSEVHYSYSEANINGKDSIVEYIQIDKSLGPEAPALATKSYTFACAETDFCSLTGMVSANDSFKDEFFTLFDEMANTIFWSEADTAIRNKERKAEIAEIAAALSAYKSDHGNYPEPESSTSACLNSKSSITSDLSEYLPNMPVDPLWTDSANLCSGAYYYHFYPDTKEYLLVTEMEYNGHESTVDFNMICNVGLDAIQSSSSVDDLETKINEQAFSCRGRSEDVPLFIDASSRG